MPNPEVLAKAENKLHKVIAITGGTSAMGKLICEKFCATGASVYALDADATALAHQSISFRQNNQRLRGIPCEMENEESISTAVQDIVNHAPPIDLWVHAHTLTTTNFSSLQPAIRAFSNHFNLRGKGTIALFISPGLSIIDQGSIQGNLFEPALTEIVTINLIATHNESQAETVSKLLQVKTQTPGIHIHTQEGR